MSWNKATVACFQGTITPLVWRNWEIQ